MSPFFKPHDVEKSGGDRFAGTESDVDVGDGNAIHREELVAGDSLYARIQRLAGKVGAEQRGVERVPSDERSDAPMSQVFTMVSTLPCRGRVGGEEDTDRSS